MNHGREIRRTQAERMNTIKIIENVEISHFQDIISKSKNLQIGSHALDHLSEAQRKVFDEKALTNTLLRENPRGVGLQRNGRYAAFYRRDYGYLKLIVSVKNDKIEIITFINIENMPNLQRLNNNEQAS